ncbi:MAG: zinc ribbon domain-containing protein [Firmicutes bacterium]|nr:zinc ribbon domain-containing protein [Blautia sp.]MDD7371187.1 zinc ribbon domain-containing protein [Bacillota bacterium]MDY3714791.1 zinc ribbon domain-containing protein [Blautia sp.]
MKYCKKCGTAYEESPKFCKKCGALLGGQEKKEKKSKKFVVILAVLVVVLVVAGGGIFFASQFLREDRQEEEIEKEEKTESEEDLEEKEKEQQDTKEEEIQEEEATEEDPLTEEEKAREEEKKREEEEQAELWKKYEEQEKAEAEAQAKQEKEAAAQNENTAITEMHQVLENSEVEGEVLRIRAIFTECIEKSNSGSYQKVAIEGGYNAWFDGDVLKMINTTAETTTSSYERIFNYENGQLIFAYLKQDGNESRLYYKDGNIFRWSYPETTQIQDNNFSNPDFVENGISGMKLGMELYQTAMDVK